MNEKRLHRFETGFEYEFSDENKESEQKRVVELGDKFWSKLRAKLGSRIDNPKQIEIVFRSKKENIKNALHRISLVRSVGDDEIIIVGNYDIDDGSIHFNIEINEIPQDELARVLTHELVHLLQDEMEKFPDMGKIKRLNDKGVDIESPWEKEAYKLQEELYKDFLEYCKIL